MSYRQRAAELHRDAICPSSTTCDALASGLSAGEALVRHVAAIELAKLKPQLLPEHSIRELLETLDRLQRSERLPLEHEYVEATATEDDCKDLGQEIVLAFASLSCGQADFVIPRLFEFWRSDSQFYELGQAMVALAFPVTRSPVKASELNKIQVRVLQVVTAQSEIWCNDGYWPGALAKVGLPQSREAVHRLLEAVAES